MARLKQWIGSWRFAAAALIFGTGTMIESLQKWVFSTFGLDLFLTLALMGLTAHVVIVGIHNWQPYRNWLAFLLSQLRSRDPDDAPATKGDIDRIKKLLEERSFDISSFRSLAAKLPQEPMGTDGTTWAELPEGARIVVAPDGTHSLATPVNVKLGAVSLGEPSATLRATVVNNDE